MHPSLSLRSRFAGAFMLTIAAAAAGVISLRREAVQHHLSDDECEEEGLPLGSRQRAVQVSCAEGTSPWRVDAWLDRDDSPEGCLHLDALGWKVEVYYYRRGHDSATARKHTASSVVRAAP